MIGYEITPITVPIASFGNEGCQVRSYRVPICTSQPFTPGPMCPFRISSVEMTSLAKKAQRLAPSQSAKSLIRAAASLYADTVVHFVQKNERFLRKEAAPMFDLR